MIRIDKLVEAVQTQFELWLFISLPIGALALAGFVAYEYRRPIWKWLGGDWGLIAVGLTLIGIGLTLIGIGVGFLV